MGINTERLIYSASLLRSNMVQALGTILEHPETEEQLTWEQQAVIQRLHDSLTSKETNIVQQLPEVQIVSQSRAAITAEQEAPILFTLLSQSSSITFQWKKIMSILKSYTIGSMLKGLPGGLKQNENSELAHIINLKKKTFFESILKNIQHHYITLTSSLLVGLLNNIPLHCLCPETHEVLHNVPEELLHKQNKLNSFLPRITIKLQQYISDFLLKVLNLVQSEQSPLNLSVKHHIRKIFPFIKPGVCKNVKPQLLTVSHKYNELFLPIRNDKFACDIIDAMDILMFAIKSGKLDLTKHSGGFVPAFYGNVRLSALFAFLSRLRFSLLNAHPASAYAHTLFSYVKMRYISNAGSFIHTVPLDIAVLLNSFNTVGADFSEVNTEIYHAFQEEIKWKKILEDFPFSRYIQPRLLFMKLKLSHQIILKYFLEKVQHTLHQCQHLQISETEMKFNPFINPTTQLKQLKAPILLQPVNVINETLATVEAKLSREPQIITVIKSPAQQCENSHSIQSCANSTDSVIQLFNILSQKNKTKFSVTCTEQQEKVYLPNIQSSLEAVDENMLHQSITLISNYFETTDTGKIMQGFHMENYKTQGELLTQILRFMKTNLVHIPTRVLHAIDEILLHIKLDGLSALKPEMMEMCLDVSTAKTRMSAINSSIIYRTEKSSQTTHLINSSGKVPMESTTLEYEDTASTTVETITSINLQSNIITVSPPNHVTFPERETPYTNEITIPQIKKSRCSSLGYDTKTTTTEPTTSTNLKPTTIKLLPTHLTFPETESLSADKVTTSKPKTTKNTSEYDDRESIIAETTASINIQPITSTVYPPTHVTFLQTETSSTDKATTPQLETTKYTTGYNDTESTIVETTTTKLQPITITASPSIHVTFSETETPLTDKETNAQTEITETTTVNVTSEDTNTATPSLPILDTEYTKLETPTTEQKITSTLLHTSSDLHTTTSKTSYTESMPTTITGELETTKKITKTKQTRHRLPL
ncbi:uncharacterized protein LOC117282764 isoform X2 [Cryptotermes secundus]|nr:uncharacterized protein LOC117282764 isoform X2 [Cryptotermes secundus]